MNVRFRLLSFLSISLLLIHPVYAQSGKEEEESKANEEEVVSIEEVVTIGRPIKDYVATDALTGTKSNALLKDLPLALSVVPQELINDRSLTYLGEALDSVSGAQRKLGYGGTQNFGAFLRGFDANFLTLRNGLRDSGFYTQRDTSNVERFEVLKGPASILYGALSPGGITNTITKKPTDDFAGRINASIGSHDYYRIEADLSGPLTDSVSARVNLSYENSDSFRDHVENEGFFIAPVIRWKGENSTWTIEAEIKDTEYTWDLGFPTNSAVVLTLPPERFLGEPDGINKATSYYVNSLFEHRFNDEWRFRQNLSYAKTDGDFLLRSAFIIDTDDRTAIRSGFDTKENSEDIIVQHELLGEFTVFGVGHQLVLGMEYYHTNQFFDFLFQGIAPIDIFNPVYGAQPAFEFPLFGSDGDTEAFAGYAQDLVSLSEKFKFLVGVRYDSVDQKSDDILAMVETLDRNNTSWSPQVGLVFQPTDETSLYASYSSSFQPQTGGGTTADGSGLDPEEGEQFEVGLKHQFFEGRAILNMAAFTITKENVTMRDPLNPVFVIQVGEQQSKGIEFDVAGAIMPGWDIIITGAHIDADVSKDVRPGFEGSLLRGVARWSGSVWTKYSVQKGALTGLSLGIGAFYNSKRDVAIPNTFTLPSHVRVDAMARYDISNWSFQLNVNNITDDDIYDVSSTAITPQEPRSVRFNIGYNF